jgi:hypothetical protein
MAVEHSSHTLIYAAVLGGLMLYFLSVYLCSVFPHYPLPSETVIYVYRQDRWLLLAGTGLLLIAGFGLGGRTQKLQCSTASLAAIAIGVICFCRLGYSWILCGFDLSRDEQLANFDSQIFRSGHLVRHLPAAWQSHAEALNTLFMLPAAHPIAWVSAYLPMNALLRSVVGLAGDPALTSPLMVALGMFALWKCARILWPEDREAAVVAVLLYIGSGQILFTGMTAYAMTAHLALNLLWLWFFLLDRRGTDGAALLVGFLATGLHQPVFHPLFAAPILFTLLLDRNWPRVIVYAAGYAAICAFWLAWPIWMHSLVARAPSVAAAAGTDYFSRLSGTVTKGDPLRWLEMAANLLRFCAWQHMLMVPFILAAIPAIRKDRLAAVLAVSLLLPVGVMTLIMPYQGYGFGYRYLHGVLGPAILLAVFGWRQLVITRSWLRPLLLRTSALGLFVLMPLQGAMAYSFYAPYAQVERRIDASGADYFIAGWEDAPGAREFVFNRPDLSNRPIRLLSENVDGPLIRNICHRGIRVAMPTSALLFPIESYLAVPYAPEADDQIVTFSHRLTAAGCMLRRLDTP